MAFEFGMFHEFQRTAGTTEEDAFRVSFEQVDAAERWGLDAMWLGELHFDPARSVLSAPLSLKEPVMRDCGRSRKRDFARACMSQRRITTISFCSPGT